MFDDLTRPTCISPESWTAFVEVRRKKGSRAPLTEYGASLVAKKLIEADRSGYDAQYMLDQAIEHGWTSVYVRPDTPRKVSKAADETRAMLDSRKLTDEQRAASNEARLRAMASIRRVS